MDRNSDLRKKIGKASALLLAVALLFACLSWEKEETGTLSLKDKIPAAKAPVITEDQVFEAEDPETAAVLLSSLPEAEYEETLRSLLNEYYAAGDPAAIAAFEEGLDARAEDMVARYRNAAEERNTPDLNYEKDTVLVLYRGTLTVPAEVGAVVSDEVVGEYRMAMVDLSLEYSVREGAAAIAAENDVVSAQPNYLYTLSEGEEEEVPEEELFPETEEGPAMPEEEEVIAEPEDVSEAEEVTAEEEGPEEILPAEETAEPEEEAPVVPAEEKPEDYYSVDGTRNRAFGPEGINCFAAWDLLPMEGTPVRVGIIDTGVNPNHEDLDGVIDVPACRTVENGTVTAVITDDNGHGTHVCGLIAANAGNGKGMAGVASGYDRVTDTRRNMVQLVVVDALYNGSLRTGDIVKGIYYLTDEADCRIINMSFGGPGTDGATEAALKHAYEAGVFVSAAAGNERSQNYSNPGDSAYVCGVINASGKGSRYASSNYGTNKEIAAPGVSLYSTTIQGEKIDRYTTKTGTSMSAPVVSACAAMALYERPGMDLFDLRNLLYGSTFGTAYTPELGFGYVDAYALAENGAAPVDEVTEIELSTEDKLLYTGDTYPISYRVLPAATTLTHPLWESSDPSVATVAEDGFVTAVSPGTCTVTGTAGGVSASLAVTVEPRYPEVTELPYEDTKATSTESPMGRLHDNSGTQNYSITYVNGYSVALKNGESLTVSATSDTLRVQINIFDEQGKKVGAAAYAPAAGGTAVKTVKATSDETIYIEVGQKLPDSGDTPIETGSITTAITTPGLETTVSAESRYNSLDIHWSPAASADGYDIFLYDEAEGYRLYETVEDPAADSLNVSGLRQGTVYTVSVRPYKRYGDVKRVGYHTPVTAGTKTLPTSTMSLSSKGYDSMAFTWTKAAGASGYYLYRYDAAQKKYVKVKKVTAASASVSGLSTNTKYYFRVRAYVTENGKEVLSLWSNTVSGKPVLGKTKITKAAGGKGKATLTWSSTAGATGYRIYRYPKGGKGYTYIKTVSSGTRTFTDTGRKAGTYQYVVRPSRKVTEGGKTKTIIGGYANEEKVTVR